MDAINDHSLSRQILDLDLLPEVAVYVHIIVSSIIFLVLCYMCVQFLKNLLRGTLKKGNYNFFFFYLALQLVLLFRLLYTLSAENLIRFPPFFYGMWCYAPSLLAVTCALFFIDTMIFSLLDAKGAKHLRKYQWVRLIPLMILFITWLGGTSLFLCIVHQHYNPKTTSDWRGSYYYFSASLVWITWIGLFLLTIRFMRNLKHFTHVYNQKKTMLYTVLTVMIIQQGARVVHLILAGRFLNDWEEECIKRGDPSVFIYYGCYFMFCDVIPAVVFSCYLRLEIYHRQQAGVDSEDESVPATSVVEKLEAMYRSKSDVMRSDRSTLRMESPSFLSDNNSAYEY